MRDPAFPQEISDADYAQLKAMLSTLEVVGSPDMNAAGTVSLLLEGFIKRMDRLEAENKQLRDEQMMDDAIAANAKLEGTIAAMRRALEACRRDEHTRVDDGEGLAECGSSSLNWFCHKAGLPDGACLCGIEAHNRQLDRLLAGDLGKGWLSPEESAQKQREAFNELYTEIRGAMEAFGPAARIGRVPEGGESLGNWEHISQSYRRLEQVLEKLK